MSLQIPVLLKQVFKFILYNNIVWLVKLARQCVHSHSEQLANRFQEGRAKNLLPLRINLVAGTHSSKAGFETVESITLANCMVSQDPNPKTLPLC